MNVTVVGSINVDVVVGCMRLPRPGETVFGRSVVRHLGGKGANQAVAASRVCSRVKFFAAIGADDSGTFLQERLRDLGVADAEFFVDPSSPSGTALITVDESGGNSIVVVPGANDSWPESAADALNAPTICVAQFEIRQTTVQRFFARNRSLGGRNILNPAPFAAIPNELLSLTDRLVLNETEYLQFRSMDPASPPSAIRQDLKESDSSVPIIVTLGNEGVLFKLRDEAGRLRAHAVNAVDSTGAGDCFVGVFAALLAEGRSELEAVQLANAAAAISVTRPGAASSMPTLAEILPFGETQSVEPL